MVRWGVLLFLLVAGCAAGETMTYVTGLWDMKRGSLESLDFKRSFESYLNYFKTLLQTHDNLIIFGDAQLEEFVQTHRRQNNTLFVLWEYEWFRKQWHSSLYASYLTEIKLDPVRWARYSWMLPVQLEHYNDVVLAKFYLMLHALKVDPFQSDNLIWVDAGLNHVYKRLENFKPRITHGKLWDYFQGEWLYRSVTEYKSVEHSEYYSTQCVGQWVAGGTWGGPVEQLPTVAAIYENLMRITLERRHVYTEQTIFSLMVVRYPYLINHINNQNLTDFMNFLPQMNFTAPPYMQQPLQLPIRLFKTKTQGKASSVLPDQGQPLTIVQQQQSSQNKEQQSSYMEDIKSREINLCMRIFISIILIASLVNLHVTLARGESHLPRLVYHSTRREYVTTRSDQREIGWRASHGGTGCA